MESSKVNIEHMEFDSFKNLYGNVFFSFCLLFQEIVNLSLSLKFRIRYWTLDFINELVYKILYSIFNFDILFFTFYAWDSGNFYNFNPRQIDWKFTTMHNIQQYNFFFFEKKYWLIFLWQCIFLGSFIFFPKWEDLNYILLINWSLLPSGGLKP